MKTINEGKQLGYQPQTDKGKIVNKRATKLLTLRIDHIISHSSPFVKYIRQIKSPLFLEGGNFGSNRHFLLV